MAKKHAFELYSFTSIKSLETNLSALTNHPGNHYPSLGLRFFCLEILLVVSVFKYLYMLYDIKYNTLCNLMIFVMILEQQYEI